MTVTSHVDDLKISHVDEWEITKINWLAKIYGDIMVKREQQHEYHVITLDYKKARQVRVSRKPFVDRIIKNFLEEIGSHKVQHQE